MSELSCVLYTVKRRISAATLVRSIAGIYFQTSEAPARAPLASSHASSIQRGDDPQLYPDEDELSSDALQHLFPSLATSALFPSACLCIDKGLGHEISGLV